MYLPLRIRISKRNKGTINNNISSHIIRHFVKTNASDPVHFGFFSPANTSEWYWPTVGLALPGLGDGVLVLAMRMFNAGGGLFPFAMAGMDVLRQMEAVGGSSGTPARPVVIRDCGLAEPKKAK